jgi:hypothetical protein
MDGDLEEALFRFFELVERGDQFGVPRAGHGEGFLLSGFGDDAILVRGQAVGVLGRLQRDLSGSALARGGPSKKFVADLVVQACRVAQRAGPPAAVAWLEERLSGASSAWTVIEPISGYLPMAPCRVGRTVLHPMLEAAVGPELLLPWKAHPKILDIPLDCPVLAARVEAQDAESAHRRARDLFDEARSLLTIAGEPSVVRAPLITVEESGRAWSSSGRSSEDFHLAADALSRVHVRGLEDAAAKRSGDRNDWQRRSLAACRWFRKANATDWPSEALAACMTLLECLFVEGRSVRNKGEAIARRIAPDWRLPGLEDEQTMHDWIIEMYRRRNDAVHDGAHYLDDAEIDRLLTLARYAVGWAGWHLDPDHEHHLPEHACSSFAEAMSSESSRSSRRR